MKNLTQAKKLIEEECANHQRTGPFGIKNFCWMKEKSNGGVCVFFTSESPKCRYFEEAVLPLDEDLKESMEEMKDAGIENRSVDFGEGIGQSLEGVGGISERRSEGERVSVSTNRRENILSRTRIYGVAPEKPKTDCRLRW